MSELTPTLPDRVCIWDADKGDPTSTRGWTTSFPEDHHNIYVRANENTRAAPDVPELVAVSHEVFYAPTREWRKTVEPEYYRKNGDLVRDLIDKSKAARIIAAKDAEINRLRQSSNQADQSLVDKYRDPQSGLFNFPTDVAKIVRRLEAAEAKLAQYEAQKPVAWRHPEAGWTDVSKAEVAVHCKHGTQPQPLYASPAPAEDLKAKCDRYEQTLRVIAELSATGMSFGDMVFAVTISRAALNVETSHDKG